MASLSTLSRADSRVERLVRRHGEVVVAHARQGAIHAVELLADVLADDARLGMQPVALGGVGRPVHLEQGVADDRADDEEGQRQGDPLDQEGRAGRRPPRRAPALRPARPACRRRRWSSSAALTESVLMAKARAARPPPFSKRGT